MAAVTLRTIEPRERDAVLDLLAGWLNDRAFFARYFAHDPTFRDDLCFVAEAAAAWSARCRCSARWCGSTASTWRSAASATSTPIRNGAAAGLAGALLERAIAAMDAARLRCVAAVRQPPRLLRSLRLAEPARASLSFISQVRADRHRRRPCSSRSTPARDLDEVMAIYDAYSAEVTGATVRDAAYWRGQLRYAGNPDERFLVARHGGRLTRMRAPPLSTTSRDHRARLPRGRDRDPRGRGDSPARRCCHGHGGRAPGSLAQLCPDAPLAAALVARGLEVRTVDDRSWMWRALDVERLAARLRLPVAAVRGEGFFADLLPATSSRYWISDRF